MLNLSSIALRRSGLRSLAVLMAVFCVLASGRALVPGMCATQRALEENAAVRAAASCCSVQPASCCSKAPAPPAGGTRAPGETNCAFCHLAKAVAENPAPVFFPAPPQSPAAEPLAFASIARAQERDHHVDGRAPPAHA
ncbi:MAG: hypothetical protein GC168_15170 [Candidatus Hydrogenedens sp.]|nr:hypothetical protein [Candidatus Hydrogenedens sp.]